MFCFSYCTFFDIEISPLSSILGAVVSHEILKIYGVGLPIQQILHISFFELFLQIDQNLEKTVSQVLHFKHSIMIRLVGRNWLKSWNHLETHPDTLIKFCCLETSINKKSKIRVFLWSVQVLWDVNISKFVPLCSANHY